MLAYQTNWSRVQCDNVSGCLEWFIAVRIWWLIILADPASYEMMLVAVQDGLLLSSYTGLSDLLIQGPVR